MQDQDAPGGGRIGTALVALSPPRPAPTHVARPLASFVAQLIACERRLPAYRDRRRAAPADAQAEYRSAAQERAPGPSLDRSL